jgi:hypothetical protein
MSRPAPPTPTDLLDESDERSGGHRLVDDVHAQTSGTESTDGKGLRHRSRCGLAMRILAGVVLLSTVSVLFVELRHTDMRATFAHDRRRCRSRE